MTITLAPEGIRTRDLEFDQADRIRRALRVSGVSVQDLADALEVSRNTVGNWINGHGPVRVSHLMAIAAITGAPFAWLKDGNSPSATADGLDLVVHPPGLEPGTHCFMDSPIVPGDDDSSDDWALAS